MKTLYESILSSTKTGMVNLKDNMVSKFYKTSISDRIDIDAIKKKLGLKEKLSHGEIVFKYLQTFSILLSKITDKEYIALWTDNLLQEFKKKPCTVHCFGNCIYIHLNQHPFTSVSLFDIK